MPRKPRSRCTSCRRLHSGTGKCGSCRAAADTRPSASVRGYDHEHREQFRAGVIANDPTCRCDQPGQHGHGAQCTRPSQHADHHPRSRRELVALGLDPNDPKYGRGLCAPCHSSETTRKQPGGFLIQEDR